MRKYHSNWCDLRLNGQECNCEAGDDPKVSSESRRLVISADGPRVEGPELGIPWMRSPLDRLDFPDRIQITRLSYLEPGE